MGLGIGVYFATSSSSTPSVGAVGKTANVGGIKLTLEGFVDPARGSTMPATNQRFVSLQFQLSNPTSSAQGFGSDAIAAVGSDGQIYQAYLTEKISVTGCSNFSDYPNAASWPVGSNATASGCVVFELPVGVKVSQVIQGFGGQFTYNASSVLWTITHALPSASKVLVKGTLEVVGGSARHGATVSSGGVSFTYGATSGSANVNDTSITVGASGKFQVYLVPGSWEATANLVVYLQGPSGPGTGIDGGGRFTVVSHESMPIIIEVNETKPALSRVVQIRTSFG